MMPSWITRLKCDIDSDAKFLLSQIQVKFNCQRPRRHFQVFGLDFSAFSMDWAYCTLVHFNLRSWQFNLNLVLSLIKYLIIGNFCDGFENNLPDCCPGGEESNTEEKRIWMAMV